MKRRMPIFYSALLLTGVNLLLRMVSTSFQVYISGRIGAAGVGLLQLVQSVGALATTAGIAGIRTATMYLTAEELGKRKPQNVPWILSGCLLYSILCSFAVGLLLHFFAPVIAQLWIGDPRTAGALRLLALTLPLTCLCGCMTGYFTAANRIGTLAAVELAEQLCAMGVTLSALHFWAGTDPGKACQAVVLGSCAGAMLTFLSLFLLRLADRQKPGNPVPTRKRILDIALPLALADDLKVGINTAENLTVPKRLALYPGAADPLAQFGMVCGMVFPVMMFPAAILFGLNELLIPELARCNAAGSRHRIRYLVRRGLRIALLYGVLCCGILWLLSDWLCVKLYSNPEAGIYLRRFSLMVPMLYCDTITDAMSKGLGQQKICVRYNILTSALDVLFLFILLPEYGMDGYFSSFLVTHVINFALSLRLLLKVTGEKIHWKLPAASLSGMGLAMAAATVIGGYPGKILAYLAVLWCLLAFCNVVGKEDLQWLRGLFRAKTAA